jgi:hypothetical protein
MQLFRRKVVDIHVLPFRQARSARLKLRPEQPGATSFYHGASGQRLHLQSVTSAKKRTPISVVGTVGWPEKQNGHRGSFFAHNLVAAGASVLRSAS